MTYKALILASAIEVTGQRRNANMIDLKFKLLDWIIWIKPVDRLLFSERHEIGCKVYVYWYMAIVVRRTLK
jgi:DNA modification methylase